MNRLTFRPGPFALVSLLMVGVLVPTTFAADNVESENTLKVSSDFPGGSVQVEKIDDTNNALHVRAKKYDERGWVCWWYFKVDNLEVGKPLTLTVKGGGYSLPNQPVYSTDQKEWKRFDTGKRIKSGMTYTVTPETKSLYLAWGPPFTLDHAKKLTESVAKNSKYAKAFTLAHTREKNPVPALEISQPNDKLDDADRKALWVQARQHAWEAGSSWVCQGFTRWLVSDAPDAQYLRQHYTIYIVPIMDVDNVQRGAGGKQQVPHDHNRDWSDKPHWHSVQAAQERISKLDKDKKLDMFIDLHNPGAGARDSFLMVPPPDLAGPVRQRNLEQFSAVMKDNVTGPIPYKGRQQISGKSYDKMWKTISKNWICRRTNPWVLSVTYEVGWNTPGSTMAGYQQTGRQLGQALAKYLSKHHARQ